MNALKYAPFSTLIGVIIFFGCISAFGGWGLLSLIFVLPFIKGFTQRAIEAEMIKKIKGEDFE
jgi:hypothetical protein